MDLGRLGVSIFLDSLPRQAAVEFVQRVEAWGYTTYWLPEALGREPFATLSYLAAHTDRITLATGVANIYGRDPVTMRSLAKTLAELSGGRFVLGLGVSHAHLVSRIRGHDYGKPVATMRRYLKDFERAIYQAVEPERDPPVVIAALQPEMLRLAAKAAVGAHTYYAPPEHTRRAREILGEGPWLGPGQFVLLETDATKARAVARKAMKIYSALPAYRNNLLWLGFREPDFADGGSDELVDSVVAWGDETVIRERIQAHYDAGANHVCLQALRPDGKPGPDPRVLEILAPG